MLEVDAVLSFIRDDSCTLPLDARHSAKCFLEPAVTGWTPLPAGLLSLTSRPFIRVSVKSGGLPIPQSLPVFLRRDLCGSFVFLLLITLFFEDEVECGWFERSRGFENNIF